MNKLKQKQVHREESWGDKLGLKDKDNVRISFQNVNGFLAGDVPLLKSKQIHQFLKTNEIDAHAMVEMNVNWRLTPKKETLNDLACDWFETQRVTTSYNIHDRICLQHQPGGTAILTQGELANRWMETKNDVRNMGRWTSQLLRGKGGLKLRIISVYFATAQKEHGRKKIYMQHKLALLKLNVKDSVYEAFWKDFWKQIDDWKEKGEQLVICGDWNCDVRKKIFRKDFDDRQLIPCNITKHGENGPGTYSRGSKPIDEIFVSSTLQIVQCGYLAHGEAAGDHRPIWVDFTKVSAFGSKLQDTPSYQARRLKCNDPRIVDRYNRLLLQELRDQKMFSRLEELYKNFTVPLSNAQILELEQLDTIRFNAMVKAEQGCRKLRMGDVNWSPKLQHCIDTLRYLKLSLKRRTNYRVSA